MSDVNLDALISFQELVKQLNISRAAEALNYTQQALSYQIAQLEEKLNVQLFERQAQGLVITEAGQRLNHALPQFFKTLDQTMSAMQQFTQKGEAKTLRLYLSNGWDCNLFTSQFLLALLAAFPEIEIKSHWVLQHQLAAALIEQPNSIALGYHRLNIEEVENYELFSSPAVLAADCYKGEQKGLIAFNDEHVFPFVRMLKDRKYDYTLGETLEHEYPLTRLIVNTICICRKLAMAGEGSILTHEAAVADRVADHEMQILQRCNKVFYQGILSWHKNRQHYVSIEKIQAIAEQITASENAFET
ncbi:hypothetical protein COW36_11180 [bacterium (Candidatus Blackallbacteria) CG17_big_fil_post_rev_8_21_14_2_50_48_46]|uniref:HTH lysR-type domain-containing protein n=1 Tax=bacterium (Candidatus Blackallbacteria) CG17_big_fil_post_rev_8_21_14_2_50_48_46 TaxID=2014261 RepID=A0A2M7G4R2_9BACT|nr:MAG: hypothetical protein COW64_18275 [bacterium (Candidatus Blackallbacteria) CG18_big_fil_WC_8_21_14_2_50_49_26]PIW16837.1 MAG: hypothetical protein COW36_11180 [bacterium (Candidatus Blackallbacteria) CG17_big_fil_post_rev_8_21_14_2_50_48_46]PIW48034.1 MAG: hypothetical protein COW20_10895 [bacterium (Candidatus Blackallbacteria) CG13_big_fil_rev_8_21_14_2_50_49_14]